MRKFTFIKTMLLAIVMMVGSGSVWGQTPVNGGIEAPKNTTTDWTTTGTFSTAWARTGTYSLLSASSTSTSNLAHTNATIVSVPASGWAHVICWAQGINSNANASCGGTMNGTVASAATQNIGITLTQLSYNKQNTTAGAVNFTLRVNSRASVNTTATQTYFDDVIMYVDNATTADLINPTAATSITTGTVTASSAGFNWTNGSDAGTGIQNTIILRTTNLSAVTPVMNNQGVYTLSGGTAGPNVVSTDWTVISISVGSAITTYTDNSVSQNTSYKYAVIHRDLAYNYSTALVSGTITTPASGTPTITLNPTTLSSFNYVYGNGPSGEQSFTTSGANLTNDISVTPSTNYEISTGTGGSFVASNPITLIQAGGTVASTTIYARLKAGLTTANYNSETINITSTDATPLTVTCSGNVTAPPTPEPTNHVTSFTTTTNSSSQVTVTWIDATGGQVPDSYLVKAAIDPANPAAPSDGTVQVDATLVKNIAQGTQTAVFTGLSASTTYNFSIWPYTNSGTSINYKTDGVVPTVSGTTQDPPLVKWDGGASTTAWSDAANWSGNAVPGSTDIVVLDNSYVSGSYSVILPSGSVKTTFLKLSITPTLPNTITLTLPVENTYGASNDAGLVVGDNTSSTDDIIINEGGVLVNSSGGSAGNGIQVNGIANGTCRINNGGKYIHNSARSTAGIVPLLSTTVGTETGIFEYDAPGTSSYSLSASGRTYGSLTLTRSSGAATYTSTGGSALTIKGNFTINSGVTYTTTMTGALNIAGNLTNNSATLTIASTQAVNFNGVSTQIISGVNNVTFAGATTIANGSTLSISKGLGVTVSGAFTNNGTLNLLSDATGTATILTPATISGSGATNVQQYVTGHAGTSTRANWYLSSPVSSATAAVFNVEGGVNKMTSYNELTTAYLPQFTANTTALTPGVGYVTYIGDTDATYTFTGGSLNNGDLPAVTVSRTGTTAGKRGFNLVGNPYPSYLDWNAVKAAATSSSNVRPTIWYRTLLSGSVNGTMTFDTFDGTTGTDNGSNGLVTQYVPPMQAFWMKVDADETSVTLNFVNGQRSHKDQSLTTNRLRAPGVDELQILRLKVSNGISSDAAIVVSDPNALDVFDYYDSQKMTNDNVNVPEIYTLAGTEELVINHLNNISANKELNLGFRPGKVGEFTIQASEITNFDSDLKVMLLDKLTNTEQELTPGNPYSFTSEATASNDRFSILFKSASITTGPGNATDNSNVLVYRNLNNQITVICNGGINEQSSVSVYNAVGQKLTHQKLTKTTTEINGTFTPGVYMVTVNDGGQNMTKKIIIK